mgnify:CR=1 FL=1
MDADIGELVSRGMHHLGNSRQRRLDDGGEEGDDRGAVLVGLSLKFGRMGIGGDETVSQGCDGGVALVDAREAGLGVDGPDVHLVEAGLQSRDDGVAVLAPGAGGWRWRVFHLYHSTML